jgi:hypothetical protein
MAAQETRWNGSWICTVTNPTHGDAPINVKLFVGAPV